MALMALYPAMVAGVLAAVFILHQLWLMWERRERDYGFPVVPVPPGQDISGAVMEGCRLYPDSPFTLACKPRRVILPTSMLQEVAHAPRHKLSFSAELRNVFLGKYTIVGDDREEVIHSVQGDLTKHLTDIVPVFQSEAKYGFGQVLGSPEDWTTITLYPKLLNLVALLSGRIFVGLPLSRDPEWLKLSIEYTMDVVNVQRATLKWHPSIRPLLAGFLPEVRKTVQALEKARKHMEPLVRDLLGSHQEKSSFRADSQGSFISWMLGNSPAGSKTAKRMGENQMVISFAAIHTTSTTNTMAIFDLAAHPEYIQPLREEIESVIQQDGMQIDHDGYSYLTKPSFAKLRLLDSFIKESMRRNPALFLNNSRIVLEDYTFENGLKLPKGAHIAFPLWGTFNSDKTPTFSPEYNEGTGNPGPEVFDGFRFAKLRNISGRESRHQAAATSLDSTNFGHGPHACPGRFFAIYETKVLLMELLMNYDIRLKDDVEGNGGEAMRPKNVGSNATNSPSPTGQIEIRRRLRNDKIVT